MYSLKTTAPGFSSAETKNWNCWWEERPPEFTLLPGAVSETVEVTSTAPLVDQTKTDVSTNITPEQIKGPAWIGPRYRRPGVSRPGVKAADSYDPTKNRYAILSSETDRRP